MKDEEKSIDALKCSECEKTGGHYLEEDDYGYTIRCYCGHYPTGNTWLDSSSPYEEAERLKNEKI